MADIPSPPPELKHVATAILRANELYNVDPVISYYCRYYAVKQGIDLYSTGTKETKAYLNKLMDSLEADKVRLGNKPVLNDDTEGAAYIETFAQRIFLNADNEDRAGQATKSTALRFKAAATFFDLMSVFGELPPDVNEKKKYCKYKATDILKCLKAGVKPTPGPPGGDDGLLLPGTGELPPPSMGDPAAPPVGMGPPGGAPPPSSGGGGTPMGMGPPPGMGGPGGAPPPFGGVPTGMPPGGVTGFGPPPTQQQQPQQPHQPQYPPQQPPTQPTQPPARPTQPPTQQQQPQQPQQPPARPSQPPPQQVTPTPTPSAPTPVAAPSGGGRALPRADPNYRPNAQQKTAAAKNAKFAMSALQFDDVPTAINQLCQSLTLLLGQEVTPEMFGR